MKKLVFGGLIFLASSVGVAAQTVEPSYKGDSGVYKIIFENENFRVIEAIRKRGVHDKVHSHLLPSVVYNVTDCKTKLYAGDAKTAESEVTAGSAAAIPVIPAHSAENIGSADCKQVFVEKK